MNERHLGSDFDDFLRGEGLLEEVKAVAAKRVLAGRATYLQTAAEEISESEEPDDESQELRRPLPRS